jgi:predicted permease
MAKASPLAGMGDHMSGLKFAFRTLFRTPFVTGVAILSLALGIGANAAIFSLFDQLLMKSLPVQEPQQLVNITAPGPMHGSTSCNDAGDCQAIWSYPMFKDLENAAPNSLVGIAAHRLFGTSLSYDGLATTGRGVLVSGRYFELLGVQPALGRLLQPMDAEVIGEPYVAVLNHGYWERELGADPSILNKTLIINGQPMTVVGVAPRGFQGTTPGANPDVFVPITMRSLMTPGWDQFDNRRNYWAYLFGRLQPGVELEGARAELNAIYSGIINEVEADLNSHMSEQTMAQFRGKEIILDRGNRGQSNLHRDAKTPLNLLFAVTGVVLLIACANIANLLLARGARRASEMAIRGSLGASRRQLLSQLLLESVVLALMGGVGSLLVASWTLSALSTLLPPEASEFVNLTLQPSVVMFAAAMSVGTGLIFGMYPAIHSTRLDLATVMKDNSAKSSGTRTAARFRSTLVVGQIALSMALLVSAGLFLKSLVNVNRVDLGVETSNTITFFVSPELIGYDRPMAQQLFRRMEEELGAIPGVTGVTAALVPILGGSNWGTDVSVQGFESGPDVDSNSRMNVVGPGYFSTLGMPLIAGREFTNSDVMDAPEVAVVNEQFLQKFGLTRENAVGSFMATNGSNSDSLNIQIVGLVQNAVYSSVTNDIPPLFFTPYPQRTGLGYLTFYVKTGNDPLAAVGAIRDVVSRLEPNLPIEDVKTFEDQVQESVSLERMISTLAAAFALLATLLASVGLYGVLAYTVAQRTREIGLRMALGADGTRVRKMVLSQMLRMTVVGAILGLLAASWIGGAAESLLYGMSGRDPLVMVASLILLSGIGLAAGYLPALRASKVDPMRALRHE